MKLSKPFEMVVLVVLAAILLGSFVVGFGCAKPEATPTPAPTPTPTPTPAPKVEIIIYSDFQCHNCGRPVL